MIAWKMRWGHCSQGVMAGAKCPGKPSCGLVLREACDRVGLDGVGTRSFRRSFVAALAQESRMPSQIRKLTGHKNLDLLLEYVGD
jgi:integrase